MVVSKLSGLYEVVLGATFIPFLLFFMLAAKRQVWHATMQLFPATQRTQVKQTLTDVSAVLRSYVVGTSMVAVTLVLASWLFFWAIGLDYSFLTGLVAGLLNLVPYLGVVLSFVPPTLVGLEKFHTVGPFLGIYAMLMFLHLITANLLFPAMVGKRVHLNALAVTVSLLFWGWIWGAAGIDFGDSDYCDHQSPLRQHREAANRSGAGSAPSSAGVPPAFDHLADQSRDIEARTSIRKSGSSRRFYEEVRTVAGASGRKMPPGTAALQLPQRLMRGRSSSTFAVS